MRWRSVALHLLLSHPQTSEDHPARHGKGGGNPIRVSNLQQDLAEGIRVSTLRLRERKLDLQRTPCSIGLHAPYDCNDQPALAGEGCEDSRRGRCGPGFILGPERTQ